MFRQSPRRNGRNKGLKIRHVVQICVLLGASVWLIYQIQHTDDKKVSVTTSISEKLHNDSSSDMVKLGRKGLQPKVKDTNVQDSKEKETIEHQAEEESNESEGEKLVQDLEDMKNEEVGVNENADGGEESREKDGTEKNIAMEHEQMRGPENEEAGGEKSGVKKEKIQTEGMKQNQHDGKNEATKEVNEEEESKEIGMGKEGNTEENMSPRSEVIKNEAKEEHKTDGKQSERKDDKESEEIVGKVKKNKGKEQQTKVIIVELEEKPEEEGEKKMHPNPKGLEIISPSENEDQSVREENVGVNGKIANNRKKKKNGENGIWEDDTSSSEGPMSVSVSVIVDETQPSSGSGWNHPSHSKTNEAALDAEAAWKKQSEYIKHIENKASPDSYMMPSMEPETAKSVNKKSAASVNGKVESDSGGQAQQKEAESNESYSLDKKKKKKKKNGINNNNAAEEKAEWEVKDETSSVLIPQEEKNPV